MNSHHLTLQQDLTELKESSALIPKLLSSSSIKILTEPKNKDNKIADTKSAHNIRKRKISKLSNKMQYHKYDKIYSDSKFISATEFTKKIETCLAILQKNTPECYKLFLEFDLSINAAKQSGANFKKNAIEIGPKTFESSIEWLASVIFHETYHFYQKREKTYDISQPTLQELEANAAQLIVLKYLGGSTEEINYLEKQDGTHWKLTRNW
jgi:hypothetical protein